MPIDDRTKLDNFDALFYEVIGGEEVAAMLARNREGASYRQLAEEHGMPVGTVFTKLAKARTTLRRLRLMPADWEPAQGIVGEMVVHKPLA